MSDPADIAGDNDFSEERLKHQLTRRKEDVPRGACLFCEQRLEPVIIGGKPVMPLFCQSEDDTCKEDYQREQLIKAKTRRMLNR